MLNIVRRKKIEKELRANDEKYKSLVEGTPDAVISVDKNGLIVSWNTGATNMFGFTSAEIIGKHVGTITPKEFREQQDKMLAKHSSTSVHQRYKSFRLTKNGTQVPVEMSLNRRVDLNGTIIGTSAFIRDITKQYNADKALRASERKFSKAFQNAPILMTISAVEDGRYLNVNDAFIHTTGYTWENVIGTSSVDLGFISTHDREQIKHDSRARTFCITALVMHGDHPGDTSSNRRR